jgi:2-polyprenyl-3-methyl-5-hydroxy-6-metoxy-1,4-benzoquinol methylase
MRTAVFFDRYPRRPCAVCDSRKSKLLFRQTFSALSKGGLMEGYDVVVCESCGFGYADRIPEQSVFDAYYRDMSKYEYQDRGGEVTDHDLARFRGIVDAIRPHLPSPDVRLLDIGCATGQLLALFKESGFPNVTGLDPSPACADVGRRMFDIRILTGTLADASRIKDNERPFDCIILIGVLEHVRDLKEALEAVRGLLSPDGLVFIEVPDSAGFAGRPDAPFQEFSTEHVNYFSATSLTHLMNRFGFSVILSQKITHHQSQSTIIPAVMAIYGLGKVPPEPATAFDAETERGLNEYIKRSRLMDNLIRKTIDGLVANKKPIIIWGVGTHTLRLLETSSLGQANIVAFVDSNPRYQGQELADRPILAPSELHKHPESILVSSRVFQADIENSIRQALGLNNEIIKLYPSIE